MSKPTKSISFDVLGTCFTFTNAITLLETKLSHILKARRPNNDGPVDATTLIFLWFFASQRDFTYLSLSNNYTPIAAVLEQTFRRTCAVVDIPLGTVTDEDLKLLMQEVKRLSARPGLKTCLDGLREHGWDVYAVTNGGKETSLGYYKQAGIELDADHLLSCDAIRVAKPDMRVYEEANRYLDVRGLGEGGVQDGHRWFVAAHAWDLLPARNAGFKTAYLTHEEYDSCSGLFGEFDVVAKDFDELLEKMKQVR